MIASPKVIQVIGVGMMAIGAGLLLVAWRGWQAPVEPIVDAMFSDRDDRTMLCLMVGIVTLIGGTILSMPKRRKSP